MYFPPWNVFCVLLNFIMHVRLFQLYKSFRSSSALFSSLSKEFCFLFVLGLYRFILYSWGVKDVTGLLSAFWRLASSFLIFLIFIFSLMISLIISPCSGLTVVFVKVDLILFLCVERNSLLDEIRFYLSRLDNCLAFFVLSSPIILYVDPIHPFLSIKSLNLPFLRWKPSLFEFIVLLYSFSNYLLFAPESNVPRLM